MISVRWPRFGAVVKICEVCQAAFVRDFTYCPLHGTKLVPEPSDHLIGTQVDRFRIEERIAEGHLGRVYRARLGERLYAVKVLIGDVSADLAAVKKFRRSAHRLSKIRNPGVAEVVEFNTTEDGLAFVASEFADGPTLGELDRPLDAAAWQVIIDDLADGLGAAHTEGVVYKNLSASHIRIVQRRGKPRGKIVDFALVGLRPSAPDYVEPNADPRTDRQALGRLLQLLAPDDPTVARLLSGDVPPAPKPASPQPSKVVTDDLALTEPEPSSPPASWAEQLPESDPDAEPISLDDEDAIVEVVVGDPDAGQWPETNKELAELCVELGLVGTTERDEALAEVASTNKRFLQVIGEMMPQKVDRIAKSIATQLGLELWMNDSGTIHPRVLATIPKALSMELGVVPYALRAKDDGNTLFVATSDPVEKPTKQAIEAMVTNPVVWRMGSPEDVDTALENAYGKEVRPGIPATMRIRLPD